MCDDDPFEAVFNIAVRRSDLPFELQANAGREAIVSAAAEALKLLEGGSPGMAERTLRLALKGGHPRQR